MRSDGVELRLMSASDLATKKIELIEKNIVNGNSKPPSSKQMEFTELVISRNKKHFLNWFDRIPRDDRVVNIYVPKVGHKYTSKEISEPPYSTENTLYKRLNMLDPRSAALPAFWTTYQIELVRRNMIEPSYFAAQRGIAQSGYQRIDRARRKYEEEGDSKNLDSCVRTILRRLGGLDVARGKASLFIDCIMARGWWRGYIANQVHEDVGISSEKIWQILRLPTAPWDEMMYHCVRRLTSLNFRSVRSAYIAHLYDSKIDQENSRVRQSKSVDVIKNLGVLGSNVVMGVLTSNEIRDLLQGGLSESN